MQIRELISDDDAVSPVIGVILMVAITVILAAVIASFVLGLGDQAANNNPTAKFTFDYDGSDGDLTITHDGGDSIAHNELYVRGNVGNDNTGEWNNDLGGSASSSGGSVSEVVAGDSVTLGDGGASDITDDYEVRVVYQTVEGDTSATLSEDKGPSA